MPDIRTNINYTVRVKLTDLGRKILMEKHDKLRAEFPSLPVSVPFDEDGNYRTQIWTLMCEFGGYMYCGADIPFETEIVIEHEGSL